MRKLFLNLLKIFNPGTIKIRHHYTHQPFFLDTFMHKGYWYHGKNRELDTMDFFRDCITPGSTVIEVGAHIGYVSQYLSSLTGETGKVLIFEPGINNIPYLQRNIAKLNNVELIQKAVSDKNGVANFYLENLTGQNNSLINDYQRFNAALANSGVKVSKKTVEVETVSLDSYLKQFYLNASINFIKMDIEGAELFALTGMTETLTKHKPNLMIEVTVNDYEVLQLLNNLDYILLNPKKRLVNNLKKVNGNILGIHKSRKEVLEKFGLLPLTDVIYSPVQ
ncbi:FkbM family methyltransferase [Adhaeribacter radiodurans]|uniref:FkbM family methyltransferase n=1 Tax=Adhaeribacter radiodurans TaxID=2745197 RepID=A0A7L7L5Y8_9BACT|nr:FkbM family methyltransferase [Adhaeribacter radiodurans]QMU28237.1 FkbM family methyltransferase [Adhaeribacter radiodurans]